MKANPNMKARQTRTQILLAGCIALLACVPTTTAQNLIVNGSFESPANAANTRLQTTPTGWAWSGSTGWIINGAPAIGSYSSPTQLDGQQFVEIGNSASYVLSQTITSTSDGIYLLSWSDATPRPISSSVYSVSVVNSSGQTVVSNTLNASHTEMWRENQLQLSLSPGDYTLRFKALGNGNSHTTLIDQVSLILEFAPGKSVSGTIFNQVWTPADSPVFVTGDIQVAGLIIEPGVTIFMNGNYVFEVAGRIKAIGTQSSPIIFTGGFPASGWQGVFFNTAQSGSELVHCIIEKSINSGIRIMSTPGLVVSHCTVANSLSSGIRIVDSVPSITDCIIRSNSVSISAPGGNGVLTLEAIGGGIVTDSPLVLDNCTIENNSLTLVTQGSQTTTVVRGGGVASSAPLTLLNCTISSNSISATSLGYFVNATSRAVAEGGGVWASTNLTLRNCLFRGNSASANAAVNSAPSSSAVSQGGGIWCTGQANQRNSIFVGNSSSAEWVPSSDYSLGGGGIFIAGAGASVVNCTVAFNTPDGLGTDTNATVVLNSIFWGNTPSQIVGTTNVNYSDVQGGFVGKGNISGNPIFLSSSNPIIVPGSPCINAGDTNVVYQDVYFPPSLGQARSDMGAHGGPGAGARLRARFASQMEVVIMGAVPGYTYLLQGSTDLLSWPSVSQFQVTDLGESKIFLEPVNNPIPYRFYRLNIAP